MAESMNMPKIENISTLENSSSNVSVTLHENYLKKDGSYYARVSRNTASFKNIISEIAEENKGLDPHLLQYSAILIQKKMLKMLEQGKAVNLLDLATMYIAMKCNAKGKSDVSEKGQFVIKLSPTKIAQDAVSSLNVDKVVYVDSAPEITEIKDLSTNQSDGTITKDKPIAIYGSKLKLGESESGIYFAPLDSTGNYDRDEGNWITVAPEKIFRNLPGELNLFVPDSLTEGDSYHIIVRTNYLSKDRSRKETIQTISNSVEVA